MWGGGGGGCMVDPSGPRPITSNMHLAISNHCINILKWSVEYNGPAAELPPNQKPC